MEEASRGQSREQGPSPAASTPPGLDRRRLTGRGLLKSEEKVTAGALRSGSTMAHPTTLVFYAPNLVNLEPLKETSRKIQEAQQGWRPGGRS